MSPTLNGSSVLERFKRSSAIEIHNRIMFNFYPGLPHIRTLLVTQDREKSTDWVQRVAAQESIDSVEGEESTVSVEWPTTHSVPSSSRHSDSTLSGTFPNDLRPPPPPPPPTLCCCARLCSLDNSIEQNFLLMQLKQLKNGVEATSVFLQCNKIDL